MLVMDEGSRLGVAKRAQNCLRGRHRDSRRVCVERCVLPPHAPPSPHEEAELLDDGGCAHRFHQRPRTGKKCIMGVPRNALSSRAAQIATLTTVHTVHPEAPCQLHGPGTQCTLMHDVRVNKRDAPRESLFFDGAPRQRHWHGTRVRAPHKTQENNIENQIATRMVNLHGTPLLRASRGKKLNQA